MKSFLKDHYPNILFFYSQIALVILVVQLASMNANNPLSTGTIIYLFVLPTFFLFIFLCFRYVKWREYYQLDQSNEKFAEGAWLPDAQNELVRIIKNHYQQQYDTYRSQIDQLQSRQEQERMFSQQWVHQMKTPLSVMHLTLQKEKKQLPAPMVKSMEEELEHLQQGLNLVLYYSRLQHFDRDFHVEKLSLQALMKENIQAFKSSFIRNHVYPEINIAEDDFVYTDRKWMLFLLNQLTSNAIKYAANTGTKIRFSSTTNGKRLFLKIQDEGVGIPKQDLPRIFDPFFTGENGRAFRESTGMGLYISKQICESLGHKLTMDSVHGRGTTETIMFTNLTKM